MTTSPDTAPRTWVKEKVHARVETGKPLPEDKDGWLSQCTAQYKFATALAHADDGVKWGVVENGAWRWSHAAFSWKTLQQLRCFGSTAELFVWRTDGGFAYRIIEEVADGAGADLHTCDAFEEKVALWGGSKAAPDGFVPLQEGQRGLHHAPPAAIAARGHLTYRHYLKDDDNGCARVVASRLVDK